MKVLMLNGSPRKDGNTGAALKEMEAIFAKEGIEVETVHVGALEIRGCLNCGACAKICPQGLNIPDFLAKTAQAFPPE